MRRQVELEWLDQLPTADPRAIASRGDLRRLNRIMGNAGILSRALRRSPRPHETLVELGAGDGSLVLRIVRSLPPAHGRRIILVDRLPVVSDETCRQFRSLSCQVEIVTQDVFDWLSSNAMPPGSSIIANLFLHHFQDPHLRRLLQLIAQRSRFFAACEPRRSRLSLLASKCLGLVGCNAVTRHDAVVSVLAGFLDEELTRLWPDGREWSVTESIAGPFSHRIVAFRNLA